jgi:hypothetical protein
MIDYTARQEDEVVTVHAELQLMPKHWYGWQMLPGYAGKQYVPYFSPIWMKEVTPRKTGKGILTIEFINALYAEGVQYFTLDLRVLKREASYLVSEIRYEDQDTRYRTAIISRIEFDWIRLFCPDLWTARPPSSFSTVEQGSVSHYLKAIFPIPD